MKAFGLKHAGVDGISVECPTCARRAGLPCAIKADAKTANASGGAIKKGDWIGSSRRCHSARVSAALKATAKSHKEST